VVYNTRVDGKLRPCQLFFSKLELRDKTSRAEYERHRWKLAELQNCDDCDDLIWNRGCAYSQYDRFVICRSLDCAFAASWINWNSKLVANPVPSLQC